MYKSIYYDDRSKTIHLWGDGKHDDEGYQTFNYKPYAYLASDNGKYTTIDGFKCDKVEHWSDTAAQMGMVYEHDVPPTTRFLIDKYWETDEVSKDNKVLFLDIEIEKGEKYSKPSEAYNVINAMTYRATGDEHYTCLIIADRSSKKEIDVQITDDKTEKAVLYSFTSEEELLTFFIKDYVEIGHNIITGWNVEFFDMPYLYNRLRNVFDNKTAKKLSPDAEIVTVRDTTFGQIVTMAGVTVLDYLDLYRKFTYTELSNYRLDTVSKYELKRGKVEYEGDLDHLYKTDPERYAYYNIVDVELVMSLDKKMQFIETALGICHKGHCSHSDVKWTSAYLDGAALTFCRRKGLVASSNRSKKDRKAQGAFVQKPVPGLYKWIFDLDLTSLYPSVIISLNISPETKFGRVLDWDEEEYATKKNPNKKYTVELIKDSTPLGQFTDIIMKTERNNVIEVTDIAVYLEQNNLSIASNGIMYTLDKQGFIPAILSMWFDERAEYKGLRKKYENDGNEKLANFYDQQQLITKILLNSFYGVLLLDSFRFYDRENGESVTLTGQSVINWSSRAADAFYNRELSEHNCIYNIEFEDGSIKTFNGLDKVNTNNGVKYVYMLNEEDEIQ